MATAVLDTVCLALLLLITTLFLPILWMHLWDMLRHTNHFQAAIRLPYVQVVQMFLTLSVCVILVFRQIFRVAGRPFPCEAVNLATHLEVVSGAGQKSGALGDNTAILRPMHGLFWDETDLV
jgi:hypothetical protein